MHSRKRSYLFVTAMLLALLLASCASEKSISESSPSASSVVSTESRKIYRIDEATNTIAPIDPQKHSDKVVLLTFDDGPKEKELSVQLLDTLDKHKAKAVFFMNGNPIEQNSELVKFVHDRGQTIGNHSWDHIDLSAESKENAASQLDKVQTAVKGITGIAPVFFRPPFLAVNDSVSQVATEAGLTVVTCSIDSRDWEMTPENNDPNALVQRILDQIHPGANILMHELPWTAIGLDTLLTKLEEQGYSFVDPQSIQVE